MDIKLPENCPQCHNQCPADALKCGRGSSYFEALKNGETPDAGPERRKKFESDQPLVRLLVACGRVAEHRSEKMREHGADEAKMFQCLTGDEQAALQQILEKLEQTWREDHAKHHGDHGHREKHHEH
ncbi:MAG: hypothetical protein IJ206_07030 [Oscillospiraceae bacterium]|nr:hypothetical protein [Oscillospiraceae bacterium]